MKKKHVQSPTPGKLLRGPHRKAGMKRISVAVMALFTMLALQQTQSGSSALEDTIELLESALLPACIYSITDKTLNRIEPGEKLEVPVQHRDMLPFLIT